MSEHRRSGVPPLERTEQPCGGVPPLERTEQPCGGVPPRPGIESPHADSPPRAEKTANYAAGRRIYDSPSEFGYFRPEDAVGNLAGNLPHWRQEGVTYFVTFRLADSLPQVKLQEWLHERDAWFADHPKPWDALTNSAYHRRFTARIERWLDAGYGSCALARPEIRSVVVNALPHFDGMRYQLDAWVIMPNHVHAVLTPLADNRLSAILHTWKSFTSHAISRLQPDWHGPFWQKESFDHIVRGPDHLERFRIYVADNPRGLSADAYTLCCAAKEMR